MDESSPQFKVLLMVQPGPQTKVDIDSIREITENELNNLPPEDRAMAWLCLMEVFPENPNDWNQVCQEKMDAYNTYVELLNLKDFHTKRFPPTVTKEEFGLENIPLIRVIHNDIIRTGRHIEKLPVTNDGDAFYSREEHVRRIERILYVIGSVNPAHGYMQGFNELIQPIYSVLVEAESIFGSRDKIEALSFFCLHNLLSKTNLSELFTTADRSSFIINRLATFDQVLSIHVPKVADACRELKIEPLLYSYRWISLLFCQDYVAPELISIWDALLAHFSDLVTYACYIGVAQVKLVEDSIDPLDYSTTLEALQRVHAEDVGEILSTARRMWQKDFNPSFFDVILKKLF